MSQIMKTSVYCLNTFPLKDPNKFEYYFKRLSASMQKKITEYQKEDDLRLALGSRVLMQKVFALNNVDLNDCEFYYNDKWKPFLKDRAFEFNISHSGDYAALAISNEPVGVDIEYITEHGIKIAEKFFHKEEAKYLNNILAQDRLDQYSEEFIRIWTQKEAYVKALGEGVKMGLASFNVFDELNLSGYKFKSLKLYDKYIISVAYKGEIDGNPQEITI